MGRHCMKLVLGLQEEKATEEVALPEAIIAIIAALSQLNWTIELLQDLPLMGSSSLAAISHCRALEKSSQRT